MNITREKELQKTITSQANPEDSMNIFEEVQQRVSTMDLVQSLGWTLKKKGRIYWTLCPFHADKTPSFAVYSGSTGGWKCYVCNKGGANAVQLRAALDNTNNFEAAKRIIEDFRLPVQIKHLSKREYKAAALPGDFIRSMEAWSKDTFIKLCNLMHLIDRILKTYNFENQDELFWELLGLQCELDLITDILIDNKLSDVFELRKRGLVSGLQ
jgi:hypothetical protein